MNAPVTPSECGPQESEIREWMSTALEAARQAGVGGDVPIGAVLVVDGRALFSAGNNKEQNGLITGHAEIQVLQKYSHSSGEWRLPNSSGLVVTAEPCLMCAGALIAARVDWLVIGCVDDKGASLSCIQEKIDAGLFDHRFKSVRYGVLANESALLLQGFFKERRTKQ